MFVSLSAGSAPSLLPAPPAPPPGRSSSRHPRRISSSRPWAGSWRLHPASSWRQPARAAAAPFRWRTPPSPRAGCRARRRAATPRAPRPPRRRRPLHPAGGARCTPGRPPPAETLVNPSSRRCNPNGHRMHLGCSPYMRTNPTRPNPDQPSSSTARPPRNFQP
jgi:hypothetical protein